MVLISFEGKNQKNNVDKGNLDNLDVLACSGLSDLTNGDKF